VNFVTEIVPVICTQDSGVPSLSAERHLFVHVQDENDNAPVLSHHHYIVSVPENTPAGSPVVSLEASDDDVGANARLFYTLNPSSDRHRLFDVNPESGNVFVVERLDFESSDVELEHVRSSFCNRIMYEQTEFGFKTKVKVKLIVRLN